MKTNLVTQHQEPFRRREGVAVFRLLRDQVNADMVELITYAHEVRLVAPQPLFNAP